jgi:hypothetical protein
MGGALSDERTSLSFIVAPGPRTTQSVSGPTSVELVTIFYYLRFQTSLFFASYDSQGYGGGIRTRLHMGFLTSSSSLANWYPYITSREPLKDLLGSLW